MKRYLLFSSLSLSLVFHILSAAAASSSNNIMSTFFDSVPQAPTDAVLGLAQGNRLCYLDEPSILSINDPMNYTFVNSMQEGYFCR